MEQGPRYAVARVAGTGCAETLLCSELRLPRPAASILEFRKTVLLDQVDLTPDNALVQGRLRVEAIFAVAEAGAAGGPVWSVATDHAFVLRIGLPGARPGLECRVLRAHVSAQVATAGAVSPGGAILTVTDRSVVMVCVRVLGQDEVGPGRAPRATVVSARIGGTAP